jgi:hypothetical protein
MQFKEIFLIRVTSLNGNLDSNILELNDFIAQPFLTERTEYKKHMSALTMGWLPVFMLVVALLMVTLRVSCRAKQDPRQRKPVCVLSYAKENNKISDGIKNIIDISEVHSNTNRLHIGCI